MTSKRPRPVLSPPTALPPVTISVIVPAYNVEAYIDEAICSLLSQRLRFHQIIVIDDGSTDATGARLQPYAAAGLIALHRVVNGGLGSARNRGAALADGRYLYFFDGDDVADPLLCARVTAALQASPATDLVFFAAAAFLDGQAGSGSLEKLERPPRTTYATGLQAAAALQRARFFHASACMYVSRRRLWQGPLQFASILHEDAELIVRLCALAAVTQVLPEVLFHRRQRAGSIMSMRVTPDHMLGHFTALVTASRLRSSMAGAHDAFFIHWMGYLTWRYLKNCEQLHQSPPWRTLALLHRPRLASLCHLAAGALALDNLATLLRIVKHAAGKRLRARAIAPEASTPDMPAGRSDRHRN